MNVATPPEPTSTDKTANKKLKTKPNVRRPVIVEDVSTGALETLRFPSIGQAAAHLGISRNTLSYRLKNGSSAMVYFEDAPPGPVAHLARDRDPSGSSDPSEKKESNVSM